MPKSDVPTATCKHCGRHITFENGAWVDTNATGDDAMWRDTCDSHDTITAEHEPADDASGYEDMARNALTAGLTDAEQSAADTLADRLASPGVYVKGDNRMVVTPTGHIGDDHGTYATFPTVSEAVKYLTDVGYRFEPADSPIRKLLADWLKAALFRISVVGHSADWQPLIDDAKARHEALGIPWSNDFVPQYVREILALNNEED